MIDIEILPDDDSDFIAGFTNLFREEVRQYNAPYVFLVRIDNWFDVKWLGFAGKVKVPIETGVAAVNTEVQAVWKSYADVTIPPFSPSRVVQQTHLRYDTGLLVPLDDGSRLVHGRNRQRSSDNLSNRVIEFCPGGLFVWFSSKSRTNGRAAMMLYRSYPDRLTGWYTSFARHDGWIVERVRNKDRNLIERLFRGENVKSAT
jgi:hypothetical protein